MERSIVFFLSIILLSYLAAPAAVGGQVKIETEPVKKKVEQLLARMTLEEKIGQMTQVTLTTISEKKTPGKTAHRLDSKALKRAVSRYRVGSIFNVVEEAFTVEHWQEIITTIQDAALNETRLKIPVLYGIDSVHGFNYLKSGTIFPHSIGMAATFNRKAVKREGEITAYEMRACGIPWNFNPVLGLGRHPLWPRLYETYGEDPYLAGVMARVYIKAQEGDHNTTRIEKNKVATCIKHYLGYSFPLSGKDRTPAWIPERMLREYFLPPFREGVLAGSHTLMINSSEINGVPVHAGPFYLKTLLRDELDFQGPAVSDWSDIKNLHTRSRVAASHKEAVKVAVMAGVDMSMVPLDFSFYEYLLELVKEGQVPVSRIDEAVHRILMVKFKLGLFENPYPDQQMAAGLGTGESRQAALDAAGESITLLKNKKHILPLEKNKKILVTGPTANSMAFLNGGWTYTWQGDGEKEYPADKDTILEALQKQFGKVNVTYSPGCTYDKETGISKAVRMAKQADVIVACLGENTYCETKGNILDLALPRVQSKLVSRLAQTGKPVILVLVQGRPRLISSIADKTDAILMAYLPGNEGGQAIAEVIAGNVNPSGKLPITYPRYANDLQCYDHKYSEHHEENKFNPQFPFGYGLSYTQFKYKNLVLDKTVMKPGETLQVSVTVKNSGRVKGKEAVLLYVSDLYASITPPVKRLKGFKKIELTPGEEKTVNFTLDKGSLSFIGNEMKPVAEPGEFIVTVGPLKAGFTLK
jgi:beta-glucosidase